MRREVFGGINELRGIAAVAVMAFHIRWFTGWDWLAPGAYLAVDVFFVISGFVIAYAYDGRMGELGAGGFLRRRLIRLYPLFLLGLLLGAVRVGEHAYYGVNTHGWLSALAAGALFLPAPPTPWGELFISPIDGPGWSLILEVWINVGFALLYRRLSTPVLAMIVGCAAFALAMVAVMVGQGLNYGQNWGGLPVGVARVCFSFPLGLLMYRLRDRLPDLSRFAPIAPFVFAALLFIPPSSVSDLVIILAASPLLVIAAIQAKRPILARWGADSSYAIYALHLPLVTLVAEIGAAEKFDVRLPLVVCMAAVLVVAYLADRFYDRPIRAWLSAKLTPVRAASAMP